LKKITLIIVLFTTISFSASAQWWRVSILRHRYPAITLVKDDPAARLYFPIPKLAAAKIKPINLEKSDYSLELAEGILIKTAQHNMRFRIYDAASYNFSELAKLYIKQNRLSEAKWYLLQSNSISRAENDDKHTIANLMDLALIKANMGDVVLAQQDLAEARQLATTRTWNADVVNIDKEVKYIQLNRTTASKTELRYDDDVMAAIIATAANAKKTD
jgi:hypothetical protein